MTEEQRRVVELPVGEKIFLEGLAGSGKTTAGVERVLYLLAEGVAGNTILVWLPQRSLAGPFYQALQQPGVSGGGVATVLTLGGLAQRMVDLFWPVVAEAAGFLHPDEPPIFLTLETAQYYMARLVRPLLDEGYFETITIDRNRLYSQIIDNLNKSAVVGFPYTEIGERLKAAWGGEISQRRVYDDSQACASLFRSYCLEHNLLDFSLQVEIFRQRLWGSDLCRRHLTSTYQHLIVDNLEEDTPVAHDVIREWLPDLDSALLIYDHHSGYRRFLGADPRSAGALKDLCTANFEFSGSFVMSQAVEKLQEHLDWAINSPAKPPPGSRADRAHGEALIRSAAVYEYHRYYPEMLDWVCGQVENLVYEQGVQQGVQPSGIVILAPYLSDALRFSITNRLQGAGIPVLSHRPSRALREEPATNCLLTLASLAHPEWRLPPLKSDLAYALVQAIEGMDLVRAQLLVEKVYQLKDGKLALAAFDDLPGELQERITFRLGERFEELRGWLATTRVPPDEFDHFLSRLFGELLSQRGFGFHHDYQAGQATANLVESVRKFRWVAGATLGEAGIPLGKEFLMMIQDGVIAAQYLQSWESGPQDAVLLLPAYTFLLGNRPVDVQFWLDIGSRGWSERLEQPLTQPYVLSREWPDGRIWGDQDEVNANQEVLDLLVSGLLRRCRRGVYLGISEFGEQGYEQLGPLMHAFQRIFRNLSPE